MTVNQRAELDVQRWLVVALYVMVNDYEGHNPVLILWTFAVGYT